MVEVKTEKSKEVLPVLITENKNTQPLLGSDWLDKYGKWVTRKQKHEHYPIYRD